VPRQSRPFPNGDRAALVGSAGSACPAKSARRVLAGSLLVGSLLFSAGAAAKEFEPGDLHVCNARRCIAIKSQPLLNALASFYYDSTQPPARAPAPKLGIPFFRLVFTNHYVTGIAAGAGLTRFLSSGVNLDQFHQSVWYRVPARAAAGLRRATVGLAPLRLTTAAVTDDGVFAVPTRGAARSSPSGPRPATRGGHASSPLRPLAFVLLSALSAFALLARRRGRAVGNQQLTPSTRF
jgi:hypothetical protein